MEYDLLAKAVVKAIIETLADADDFYDNCPDDVVFNVVPGVDDTSFTAIVSDIDAPEGVTICEFDFTAKRRFPVLP